MSTTTARASPMLATMLCALALGAACEQVTVEDVGSLQAPPPQFSSEPLQPLPARVPYNSERVALGKRLFADPILSRDGSMSCKTCHPFNSGGADGQSRSLKVDGSKTATNTPSIFNLAFDFRYMWDGSFSTLEAQMEAPLQRSMSSTLLEVLPRLQAHAEYPQLFAAAFQDGLTVNNIRLAIVEFERALVTPNARFDRYLRGDHNAITAQEKQGYQKFKSYGCISCHQGQLVGGNMFQRMGVMGDYFAQRQGSVRGNGDLGLFAATQDPSDRHVFRVPSLRNVELTAPYMHDGSVVDLPEAVRVMFEYQLGKAAPPTADVELIVAFLKTLTGEMPEAIR